MGRGLLLVSALALVLVAIACGDQHPDNPDIESAQNAYEHGNYNVAIHYLTRAIDSGDLPDDDLGIAFYNRSVVYFEERLYDEAIRDSSEAIRLNPDYAAAFYNRGVAYSKKRLYGEAIRDYSEAIRVDPDYAKAFNNRGRAYSAKHLYDEAIRDYDQAIRLVSDYAEAFNSRGITYDRKGLYDEAIRSYDQAIRLGPDFAAAFNNRGNAYANKGLYDEGIRDHSEAIRLSPGDPDNFFALGRARFYKGDFADAARDLTIAVQTHPPNRAKTYASLWLYLSQARASLEAEATRADKTSNLELNSGPGQVVSMFLGGVTPESVLTAAADPDAKKQREQLCEAYFYVGEYLLLQDRWDEAATMFRSALDTSVTEFLEYTGAKAELDRISESSSR